MNAKSSKGAFLLLGSIILSSVLTYLLTKAKYEKKDILMTAGAKASEKDDISGSDPAKGKEKEKEKEIPLAANEVTKYSEKYARKNSELVRNYISNPEPEPVREIIDADTFDSTDEFYDGVTYTLYADGTLTDEQGHVVTDPEDSVGTDTISKFGELEQNGAVYVRNHRTKTDFEILLDLRSYKEVSGGYGINGK